jgi:hypothetical protein
VTWVGAGLRRARPKALRAGLAEGLRAKNIEKGNGLQEINFELIQGFLSSNSIV